ncbi:ABC transporter ATP-binding protein [Plantactinospora sp. B5E13]|uniref:ATP-binding cassette domain-containing protein n=1 Tax=Plantactinospora sp. B5E13 TaxID=3153758 RepID=UPI00325E5392
MKINKVVVVNELVDGDDAAPFLVVDREYLKRQSDVPKRVYVARSPDWADVVRGSDPELRFIEREQTEQVLATVREELLEPCLRGTDSLLHAVFVLGAPGAGKSTLVRRVAAMLVQLGECVVADFGVNTTAVASRDTKRYIAALDKLADGGMPVIVLLDDPFFANSGWVELLHALSRPQHRGIAVLGASPDFLFQRYAHWLFDRRTVGQTISLVKPSSAERQSLATLYGRAPSGLSSDDDLLVIAMEAAAGESFAAIIQRIWTTLNGGVPLSPVTDHRELPWQVIAFALACYFHRNYVLCPEPLLRALLIDALTETPPAYLTQELQDLVTREGWQIFSIRGASESDAVGMRLIGTTHARVSREAWKHFPLRNLDIENRITDISVQVPQAVPQLAELLLAMHASPSSRERGLTQRFAARWRAAVQSGTLETRAVASLVSHLRPSRGARLRFLPILRTCLRAQNDQSWLAAWQLLHLSSATSHPQERDFLLKVSIPWTLKHADFSAGPREAVEIAERLGGAVRELIIERLIVALKGSLGWRVDAHQVAWLIRTIPPREVDAVLEDIYDWLAEGLLDEPGVGRTPDDRAVGALVDLLDSTKIVDAAQRQRLFDVLFEWMHVSTDTDLNLARRIVRCAVEGAKAGDLSAATVMVSQIQELLRARPDVIGGVSVELLSLLTDVPGLVQDGRTIVELTFAWLRGRPESNQGIWTALLGILERSPELADLKPAVVEQTFAWLRGRPESSQGTWTALLGILGRSPELADLKPAVVEQTFDWLRDRPESNESIWTTLLGILGRSPELTDLKRTVVHGTFAWLLSRPEANESVWSALFGTLRRSIHLVEDARLIAPVAFEWLRERTEVNEGAWGGLLPLLCWPSEMRREATEILLATFEWASTQSALPQGVRSGLLLLLSTPLDITPAERRGMIEVLARAVVESDESPTMHGRGVHLLDAATSSDASLAAVAEAELIYAEGADQPELEVVFPLAYAVCQLGREDLADRLRRCVSGTLERSENESSVYLSLLAAIPEILRGQ